MRRLFAAAVLFAAASILVAPITAQTPQPGNRLMGEVVSVDSAHQRLTLKTSDGKSMAVNLDGQTVYRRVPPGETTLDKATPITLADIGVGDRVLARGETADNAFLARSLIMMSRDDIKQKKEQDKSDWERRGISGSVVSVNPGAREFVLKSRTREGMNLTLVSATGAKVRFRRYAPDSLRFSDARPGSLEDLKVGDLVRALGNKSADGTSYVADEVVYGSFRVVGGKVTAVNPATGEVTIDDLQTQHTLTLAVNKSATVRRIPPEMLALMEQTAAGGTGPVKIMTPNGERMVKSPGGPGGPGGGGGGQRVIMTPDGERHVIPAGKSPEEVLGINPNVDFQEMIEKLPAITAADLKPGDGVIAMSTKGSDDAHATAIIVAAGVESFLSRKQEAAKARPAGAPLDLALPGIGAP